MPLETRRKALFPSAAVSLYQTCVLAIVMGMPRGCSKCCREVVPHCGGYFSPPFNLPRLQQTRFWARQQAARVHQHSDMLYADKAALENRTKLRLLAIRERELALYTKNCFTIGTVSALMAGLAYSSLLYATKRAYYQDASALIQTMYVMGNVTSMYLALRAMTGTTMIAMFAPGKVRAPSTFSHWRQFPRRGADGGA